MCLLVLMTATIGILQTGSAPEPLIREHGDFPAMFERLLGNLRPDLRFRVYRALDGELPDSPAECDAWLITGSRHSVLDNSPWMTGLADFVRCTAQEAGRLAGICFGHQLVASALGGQIGRAANGWSIGRQTYEIDAPAGNVRFVALNAIHEDQVIELPDNARVLGGSESCPYAIVEFNESILTIQAHPEFDNAFLKALLRSRMAALVSKDQLERAIASLDGQPDSTRVARMILDKLDL